MSTATRGPAVEAVSIATFICCSIFVILRLTSRFAIVRKPGYDDYCIILAWVLAFGISVDVILSTTVGLGRHEDSVRHSHETPLKKGAYVFSVLYNPALMATKTSILVFYLSLSTTSKVFRRATIIVLVVVNGGGLALTLLNTLQCSPVDAAWQDPVPKSAKCMSIVSIYLSSAPLNIVTDLAILFLPMPILTSMRLPSKQKIILVITFSFGVFVAVVDVVRIAYLTSAAEVDLRAVAQDTGNNATDQRDSDDFSWYIAFSIMWSIIEVNVGIMCACVPAMKPLVTRFLPSWVLDHTVRDKGATHTSDSNMMTYHPDIVSNNHREDPEALVQAHAQAPEPPLSRPSPAHTGPDAEMDFVTFLTTADGANDLHHSPTAATYATSAPRRPSMTFFDFVDMGIKKNITLMSNRESIYPILMVTVLFFIWGFAYGLLDTLNAQFQDVANMSTAQTQGQHSAYYLGYIISPLTFGRLVFRRWGFKACYMVGLCTYAAGCLVFWPSAVLSSFPAFLVSNFVVGLGLSTLEISANPFIALCGPPEYAEVRLNWSQGIQAIGTVLSPLLAKKVLFRAEAGSLIDVQWAYLGIAFFNILLAIVYYYVPLPEATDEELEDASARLPIPREATLGTSNIKLIWVTLGLGALSMFCYVGAQEGISTSFAQYIERVKPGLSTVDHQAIGHTLFAISRFAAALIGTWVKPRYQLLFWYAGAIAFSAACMNGYGITPAAMILMAMFFEGPLFALIYVQPLRGMGRHTKDAASLVTAAIGGGAVFPPIMYGAIKAKNVQYAYCVVVAALAGGIIFPIWQNGSPVRRKLSDPVRDRETEGWRAQDKKRRDSHQMMAGGGGGGSRGDEKNKKKRFSGLRKRFSRDREGFVVEHRERRSVPEGQTQNQTQAQAQEQKQEQEQGQSGSSPNSSSAASASPPDDPNQTRNRNRNDTNLAVPPHSREKDPKRLSDTPAFQTTPAWLRRGSNASGNTSGSNRNANGHSRAGSGGDEIQRNESPAFDTVPAWLSGSGER